MLADTMMMKQSLSSVQKRLLSFQSMPGKQQGPLQILVALNQNTVNTFML